MTIYNLGDVVPLRFTVTDSTGTPADATSATLTVTLPDGTTETPSLTHTPTTGLYDCDYAPATTGQYAARFVATGTNAGAETVIFNVDPAAPFLYATLLELQDRTTDNAAKAAVLMGALLAAQGAVNSYCGRTFGLDTTASARVFDVTRPDRVAVSDIGSTSGLVVQVGRPGAFTTTLTADTGYWLKPNNAITLGRPYEWVWTDSLFTPASYPTVQVTANWGWPSVPDEVSQATLLLAQRLYTRKDSPTGVAGFGDFGVVRVTASDADVARLLDPYAKPSGGW